jgi:hypothetical protein
MNERRNRPIADRFWAKVQKDGLDGCWNWLGSKSAAGYGKFMVGRSPDGAWRPSWAHIVSWRLAHGDIPHGLFVCHRCDNPRCVNPEHLFLGTPADNQRDMAAKDRSVFGSKASWARLHESDVPEVIRLRRAGVSWSQLASHFGVSIRTVRHVVAGRSWKRVTQALGALCVIATLVAFTPSASADEVCEASYYNGDHHGRLTASGERFDMHAMTAAHRSWRFGTRGARSVTVRINDRGPARWTGNCIDLSRAAAQRLGMIDDGVATVRLERR